jgi:hypothetical protein
MIIIKTAPQSNGAYANQTIGGKLKKLPGGWAKVPEELEGKAKEFLPWITVTISDGEITEISENAEGKAAWEKLIAESDTNNNDTENKEDNTNGN